jgi:two-component system sensor histidine kinase BaeS
VSGIRPRRPRHLLPDAGGPGNPVPARRPRRWGPLTTRLMLAQAAVLSIGLAVVVAAWVAFGPPIFYRELLAAGHADEATGLVHLEEAFRTMGLTALAIGGIPALVIAGILSFFLYRGIGRSLAGFTAAAGQVAAGDYRVRVPAPRLGDDFERLAGSFNEMAAKLNAVENTRRRLLADLAHEMRTPLASLKGHLEGIQDGVVVLDERTAGILDAQIARLERLARDMRRLTEAEQAAAVQRQASAGNITITCTRSGIPRARVPLDRDRMGQVLGNLLENALRHTPAGGTISLHTEGTPGEVTVTVTDSGEGIAAEHLAHIFERFYRTDAGRETRRGSGLGLAISKALVEAQNGTLEAASPGTGHGASFRIRLPRPAPAG